MYKQNYRRFSKIIAILCFIFMGILQLPLGAFAADIVVNGAFNPTSQTVIDNIGWQKYFHNGYDSAFKQTVSPASADHIQLDGNTAKFYGYDYNGYIDYLYYKETDSTEKTFKFNISQDRMDWHTITSVGFFINCVQNSDNTYSGYFFSLEKSRIAIRKLDHVDLLTLKEAFHGGNNLIGIGQGGNTYAPLAPVVKEISTGTMTGNEYKIELKCSNRKFTVTNFGNAMFELDLDDDTLPASAVPTGYTGGNDFGLFCAYSDHACWELSYATFTNVVIVTTTTVPQSDVDVSFIDYKTKDDATPTEIDDVYTKTGYVGQTYTVNPPATIGKYLYVEADGSLTGAYLEDETKEVKLYYLNPTLTVRHEDEDGNLLEEEEFTDGLLLQTYTEEAKTFSGYELISDDEQSVTLSKTAPDGTITFVYREILGSLTVKYVDEDGNDVADQVVETGLALGSYTRESITISGYEFVGTSPQTAILTDSEPDGTITFVYKKILGSLTVKYVDEDGNDIADSVVETGLELGFYTREAINISEYTLTSASPQTVELTDSQPNQTITFVYAANPPPPPPLGVGGIPIEFLIGLFGLSLIGVFYSRKTAKSR